MVAKDLFVIQGSLTGESFPVEKFEVDEAAASKPIALPRRRTQPAGTNVPFAPAPGAEVRRAG